MPVSVRASLGALICAAALASAFRADAQTQAPAAAPTPPQWIQRWSDYRASMLDARLAGLRAGLRLTPDQEKLWAPFEAAVRDFAQVRGARMQAMLERAVKMASEGRDSEDVPALSPLDRLDMTATRMIDVGRALKQVAETAKPLYASLNDEQKRMFGFLSREMMMMGRGHHGAGPMMMGPPHEHDSEDDETDDER